MDSILLRHRAVCAATARHLFFYRRPIISQLPYSPVAVIENEPGCPTDSFNNLFDLHWGRSRWSTGVYYPAYTYIPRQCTGGYIKSKQPDFITLSNIIRFQNAIRSTFSVAYNYFLLTLSTRIEFLCCYSQIVGLIISSKY